MTADQTYVLDANVFIEAAKRYYAFDIAPSFWQMLAVQANNGWVQSIDRIKNELLRADLAMWANGTLNEFFASTSDQDVIEAYRDVMAWSQNHTQFTEAAKAEFAGVADGWLVGSIRISQRMHRSHT